MRILSTAFKDNTSIPAKYTCDGLDINPPLTFEGIPTGAKSLALIVDDPDAPRSTWVHWVVWNIDPKTAKINEKSVPPGAQQGINDFKRNNYGGPCPPSGTHRYFFKLYALDSSIALSGRSDKAALEKMMQGHILDKSELVGLYRR